MWPARINVVVHENLMSSTVQLASLSFEHANVAPVGLNDLALKPLSARLAKLITSSKMFDTVLLEIALYGRLSVSKNGFVSVGKLL